MYSEVTVIDGGFSTQLSCHVGENVDGHPLWTARFLRTNPKAVVETHLDFLRCGADAIITNTYQASIGGFVKHFEISAEEAYELIKYAVNLAREARQTYVTEMEDKHQSVKTPLIVGSVGPFGAHLNDGSEYSGNYANVTDKTTIKEWQRPRIKALLEGGVDILAFETIPCEKEVEAMCELLKEFPKAKAWMSFSCKDDKVLANGEDFQTVAIKCWESNKDQLVAVGANCLSPFNVANLFKGINQNRDPPIPLVVYPNSGERFEPGVGWVEKEKCRTLDYFVKDWLELGVVFVGGCCRTYAKDIALIRKEVDKMKLKQ